MREQVGKWLLLAYKLPRDPSATRVYVWRKLKRLAALPLQDAVWILPANDLTREHFQWLAAEIEELHGTATLWESRLVLDGQEEKLVRHFSAESESEYRAILSELEGKLPDLDALSRRFQRAQSTDYLRNKLGPRVRAALIDAKSGRSEEKKRRKS